MKGLPFKEVEFSVDDYLDYSISLSESTFNSTQKFYCFVLSQVESIISKCNYLDITEYDIACEPEGGYSGDIKQIYDKVDHLPITKKDKTVRFFLSTLKKEMDKPVLA